MSDQGASPDGAEATSAKEGLAGESFLQVMRDPTVRGARLRNDWRGSRERRAFITAAALTGAAVVALTAIAAAWAAAVSSEYESEFPLLAGLVAFGFGLYVGGVALLLVLRQQRRAWYDRAVVLKAHSALREAEREAVSEGGELDLPSLWALTQKRLDYYHQIATSQSEKSFTYGLGAAAIGFFVLAVAIVLAVVSDSTGASVVAGIVGVAGSGLSAYLGGTFMRLQESSVAQSRAYFAQPLEFSRYLAAERLLASLKPKNREPATRDLITALAEGRRAETKS